MTSGQKIAFSLLAALALFAVFVMSLHSTLFKELETRFYAQAKIEENTGQLDKISESCDSYISEILSLVEKGENAWTKNASVRTYYVQNPSESDVTQRRRLTENLFAQIPSLTGIRIIDKNGRNMHYSSYDDTDLLKQNGLTKIYKNYPDVIKDAGELSFELLQKNSSETKTVLLCDEERGRIIINVPFCWVDGIYSGMALFYLNLHEVEKELTSREVLALGEGLTLFADDDLNGGFVVNLPHGTKADFKQPFLNYWKARSEVMSRGGDAGQQPEKLLAIPDGRYYLGLSSNRIGKMRVSAVYTSDIFELSTEIRMLIYICVFISILLIVFLFFSFFRDPVVTLQKRIKKIQLGIIENYLDGKEKREWPDVARHFRQRRNDLSEEIIKSLHVHSKKRRKELSEYLDKNWDEIFAIFEAKTGVSGSSAGESSPAANVSGAAELTGASIAEIRRMLEEVLQNRNIVAPVAAAVGAGAVAAATTAAVAKKAAPAPVDDEVEEIDELDEIDEVEDLDDAEVLDEVEELDDAEELDEVEELAEEAEPVDEVEELVEEADEVEELDDAEEVDEVEELAEEAEEADEVEELAEEVDELDEAEDEVETLDDVEEEELDVLEEYVEPKPGAPADDIDAFLKSLAVPEKKYQPSNETFFASEEFPNVENLFAEELKLGDFSAYFKEGAATLNVKLYPIPTFEQPEGEVPVTNLTEKDAAEINWQPPKPEVEELTEEVPSYISEPDFSMTSFGDNLSEEVPELQEEKVIVEEDGVFSIAEDLKCTDVEQDADFKKLVDSILW